MRGWILAVVFAFSALAPFVAEARSLKLELCLERCQTRCAERCDVKYLSRTGANRKCRDKCERKYHKCVDRCEFKYRQR